MDDRLVLDPASPNASWPVPLTPDEQAMGYFGMLEKYVCTPAMTGIGDPHSAGWPDADVLRYDQISFHEFLRMQGASDAAIAVMRLGYFDMWGEGIETTSALCLLRDVRLALSVPGLWAQSPMSIAGGSDRLPTAMAERFDGVIRLNTAVLRIEEAAGGGLAVTVRSGDDEERIEADDVVCTIPFSALRAVELAVPISTRKRWAIDRVQYSACTRVFLQMDQHYWDAIGRPPEAETDGVLGWVNDQSPSWDTTAAVIEGYTSGVTSRRLSRLPEPERIQTMLGALEQLYPGAREHFVCGTSVCWGDDQWVRGSHPTMLPGDIALLSPFASTPEANGHLHFAGDHTSLLPGYMEGALESGHRVAAEVSSRR
jgi:monoamine oxidase